MTLSEHGLTNFALTFQKTLLKSIEKKYDKTFVDQS
jgi:hypothetical protein